MILKYLNRPLFKQTINLIKEIYKLSPGGGALHIVLDDGNIEETHIKWCIENSIAEIEDSTTRGIYESCAKNMLKMTESQRYAVINEGFNIYRVERNAR